jgi:hypothetical protein
VHLAEHGEVLEQIEATPRNWNNPNEAVRWYTSNGWRADAAGEELFREAPDLPGALATVRARLQRAFLRLLDSVNRGFSETLARSGAMLELPHAGEIIHEGVEQASARNPVAILILDACRYELGRRLAALLNEGEPVNRAEVAAAVAPLPSITALGMAFALTGSSAQLAVKIESGGWVVNAADFSGNLSQAAQRREWLRQRYKLKDRATLSVEEVLSQGAEPLSAKALGRLVFVFGDELDSDGHEGRLKITGSGYHLDRYAKVIRKLRSAGYPQIFVVTDHGFFHWRPDKDEVELKPEGDLLWVSRRAVVGHRLRSHSDLHLHGGATIQELVIPVITISWPRKSQKISAVLKPVERIERMLQKIEVASGSVQQDLSGTVDDSFVSRSVLVKAVDPSTGKALFKSDPAILEPGGNTVVMTLKKVPGAQARFGTELHLQLLDADDDELLESASVRLNVEIDDWN